MMHVFQLQNGILSFVFVLMKTALYFISENFVRSLRDDIIKMLHLIGACSVVCPDLLRSEQKFDPDLKKKVEVRNV